MAAVTGHFLSLELGLPADVTRISGQVITGFDGQPEVQALYNKAWDRIKATEAK